MPELNRYRNKPSFNNINIGLDMVHEVGDAVTLVERGANASRLQETSPLSVTLLRKVIRNARTSDTPSRSLPDPARYIERDPQRAAHAWTVLNLYLVLAEDPSLRPAQRIALVQDNYRSFLRIRPGQEELLDINMIIQCIALYQRGDATIVRCTRCHRQHLTIEAQVLCPLCRLHDQIRCQTPGCNNLIPEREGDQRGRRRTHCFECARPRKKEPATKPLISRNRCTKPTPHLALAAEA